MRKVIEQQIFEHLNNNVRLRFGEVEYEVVKADHGLADVWAYGPDFSFPVIISATQDEIVRALTSDIESQIATIFKKGLHYAH
jgi:hypothetical protein